MLMLMLMLLLTLYSCTWGACRSRPSSFVRGTVRVPWQPFFIVTQSVLSLQVLREYLSSDLDYVEEEHVKYDAASLEQDMGQLLIRRISARGP